MLSVTCERNRVFGPRSPNYRQFGLIFVNLAFPCRKKLGFYASVEPRWRLELENSFLGWPHRLPNEVD